MPTKASIGRAFRAARRAAGLSQDDFVFASSRTFVSSVERGLKSPTVEKLTHLSHVMNTEAAVIVLLATLLEDPRVTKTGAHVAIRELTGTVEALLTAELSQ